MKKSACTVTLDWVENQFKSPEFFFLKQMKVMLHNGSIKTTHGMISTIENLQGFVLKMGGYSRLLSELDQEHVTMTTDERTRLRELRAQCGGIGLEVDTLLSEIRAGMFRKPPIPPEPKVQHV